MYVFNTLLKMLKLNKNNCNQYFVELFILFLFAFQFKYTLSNNYLNCKKKNSETKFWFELNKLNPSVK